MHCNITLYRLVNCKTCSDHQKSCDLAIMGLQLMQSPINPFYRKFIVLMTFNQVRVLLQFAKLLLLCVYRLRSSLFWRRVAYFSILFILVSRRNFVSIGTVLAIEFTRARSNKSCKLVSDSCRALH